MPSQLSQGDRIFIRSLISAGVLEKIDKMRVDLSKGFVLVTCSDGDRFDDIYQHQVRIQALYRQEPRIHPLSWHGGSIRCAKRSPLNKDPRQADMWFQEILDATEIKQMNVVVLLAHAPCSAAARAHLIIRNALTLHMEVKRRLRAEKSSLDVIPHFHVDWGNEKKTYVLKCKKWVDWMEAHRFKVSKAIC